MEVQLCDSLRFRTPGYSYEFARNPPLLPELERITIYLDVLGVPVGCSHPPNRLGADGDVDVCMFCERCGQWISGPLPEPVDLPFADQEGVILERDCATTET